MALLSVLEKTVLCRVVIALKYHWFHQILVENPIKSVIEIPKFLFDLSPFHEVTIGLKRLYIS